MRKWGCGTLRSPALHSIVEEIRGEAKAAAAKLRDRYVLYRSASDVARTTLECNLHQIERLLADEADAPLGGGTIADIRA